MVTPKLGFHGGVGGNHNGIGASWEALRRAGKPVVFCSVEDRGKIEEVYSGNYGKYPPFQPHDVLVFRHEYSDRIATGAYPKNGDVPYRWLDVPIYGIEKPREYVAEYLATKRSGTETLEQWLRRHPNVYLAVGNETDKDSNPRVRWQMEFWRQCAEILNGMGFRCVVFNWAGGTPEPEHWLSDEAQRLLQYASDNRNMCAIGMHLYALNNNGLSTYDSHWARWKHVYQACVQFNISPVPQIIAKEAGWGKDGYPHSPDGAIAQLREMYQLGMPHDLAWMIWCLQAFPQGSTAPDRTQRLIEPVTQFVLRETFEPYPEPIIENLPIIPPETEPSAVRDFVPYFIGDGQKRDVRKTWDERGTFQFQAQHTGNSIALVSGRSALRFYYDDNYIYLENDGTQSPTLFYTQQDNEQLGGAVWLDRHQATGHVTHRNPIVTHYEKSTCAVQDGGKRVASTIKFVAHHEKITLPNGLVVFDVIELDWQGIEKYYFALEYSLVWWTNGVISTYLDSLHGTGDDWLSTEHIVCDALNRKRYFRPKSQPIEPEERHVIFGIDVSYHQPPHRVKYAELKESGIEFAIIRGGYGNVKDNAAWLHHKLAQEAGVMVAPYWFVDRRFDDQFACGVEFGRFVNDFGWNSMAWIDAEDNNSSQYGLLTPMREQVIEFCKGYLSVATHPAGIYTNRNFWKVVMRGMNPLDLGITDELWLADWNGIDDDTPKYIPPPYKTVTIAQELAREIAGVNLDYNAFFGSSDKFRKLAKLKNAGLEPPKVDEPSFDMAASLTEAFAQLDLLSVETAAIAKRNENIRAIIEEMRQHAS